MVATPFQRRATTSRDFTFNAPPTISRFMQSESFGRLLVGPVGSGKTTACLIELMRRSMGQQQAPIDGKRYTRFAVIRNTLKAMKDTVLKDALDRLGSFADWRVSESTLYIREGDIHSEWLFIPLDEVEDRKRLLSTNLTGAYVNECVDVDLSLLSDIAGRCNRYPNNEYGVPSWAGIFCDTNMPVEHTDWARFIQSGLRDEIPLWSFFRQPGGRSEYAENLNHLEQTPETVLLPEFDPRRIAQGRKYYERLVATGTPEYIRRFVDAEFGRDLSGSAVYFESFNYEFHTKDDVRPVDDRMLIIGQDFGRSPATIITQLAPNGTLLVLDEIASYDMGLYQHVKERLLPLLATERYIGKRLIVVGDPAGNAMDSIFDINEIMTLKNLGLPSVPAVTNDIDRRIRSVEKVFLAAVKGGAAIQISRTRCLVLVEGLEGAYRYARNKEGVSQPVPEKNTPFSHVQDALQYACMTATSPDALAWAHTHTVIRKRPSRQKVSARAWT